MQKRDQETDGLDDWHDVCEAEEQFDLDDLEAYAAKVNVDPDFAS